MNWNIEDIVFLYPPDSFTGSFDNAKMQARHEQQLHEKLEAIKNALTRETDPLAAMHKLHARDQLTFLRNNLESFRHAGRVEKAVLAVYGRLNSPFSSGGDTEIWNSLFAICDPERLYSLGNQVAFATATVYRGSVTGLVRSLSWTPDRQRAEGFAERWKDPSLGGGELFEVDIARSNVLVYLKHRHEEEVLLSPAFITSAEIRAFRSNGL